jgi:hypothetical protein
MKKTAGIIAALILVAVLVPPGPARGDDVDDSYYPLQEGRRWEYTVTSDQSATKKLVITNLAPREVNNTKVTPRKSEMGGVSWYELMENNGKGIYRDAEQKSEQAPPALVTPKECHLKFPLSRGNSWTMTTKIGPHQVPVNLSIDSVSEKVTVPAGSFKDCVQVKQEGQSADGTSVLGYEWYAPKVGVVKSIVTIKQKTKDGKVTTENRTYILQSFKP